MKKVPVRYKAVETRKLIEISLHTRDEIDATLKAQQVWAELVEAWEKRLAGQTGDAMARLDMAREIAKKQNYRYMSAGAVAQLPVNDFIDRAKAAIGVRGPVDEAKAAALLGAMEEPALTVSQALNLYWNVSKDKFMGMSEDQIRKKKNPIRKAIKNFIDVVGDKPINKITPDDMLDFRDYWIDRIEHDGLSAGSANKDFGFFQAVLRTVNERKRLGFNLPLGGLSIPKGIQEQRPPFSDKWISEKLLAPDALNTMNEEARAIFLVMVNTGARPSEIASLTTNTIHLNHNVPHISIQPELKKLKSGNARRKIPLTGVSLEAIREFPDGFPRYRNNLDGLTQAINKYFRENGLKETEKHTLYSLRHSFSDRLLAAGIDDRISRDLMGHALTRERYGDGASLEQLQALLAPIAF